MGFLVMVEHPLVSYRPPEEERKESLPWERNLSTLIDGFVVKVRKKPLQKRDSEETHLITPKRFCSRVISKNMG